jgi:hypothetical protein
MFVRDGRREMGVAVGVEVVTETCCIRSDKNVIRPRLPVVDRSSSRGNQVDS